MGYVLNSYWNDPITRNSRVIIRSVEEGSADVRVPTEGGKELLIKITLPLEFYGQVRTCDVDVQGGIGVAGHATRGGSAPAFYVHGKTVIIANTIEVKAATLTIDGQFWLESAEISSSPHLKLVKKNGAEVGWGGAVFGSYPWNGLTSTLAPPYAVMPDDVPSALINECSLRLPDRVLVTNDNYSFSPVENQWVARDYPNAFPLFLKLLIKHDLARAEVFGTYAQNKFRIHMNTTWSALREAFRNPSRDSQLEAFVKEARRDITVL